MAAGYDGSEKQRKEGQGKMYYPIKVHLSDAQPSIRMTCLPEGLFWHSGATSRDRSVPRAVHLAPL